MAGCAVGDEWLFDSLQRLIPAVHHDPASILGGAHPIKRCPSLQSRTAVCVAGFSTEHPNEVVQLALPEKLLPLQQQSLCARRDMKIVKGAFSKSPITSLKYIDTADLLASAGYDTSVCLWEADTDSSDMLSKTAEISLSISQPSLPHRRQLLLDWTPALPAEILVGASLQSVQLLDLHTHKAVFEFCSGSSSSPSPLHGLGFAGHDTTSFVTCSGDAGQLDLWDTRTAKAVVRMGGMEEGRPIGSEQSRTQKPQADLRAVSLLKEERELQTANLSQAETMASSRPGAEAMFALTVSNDGYPDSRFAVVGECGRLALYEARAPGRPYAECRELVSSDMVVRTRFTTSRESLCVKFSPGNSHMLSISGIMRGIAVYDTSKWTRDTKVPTPLFTHIGHEEEFPGAHVLVHSWHPHLANTVLSVDSEGSLHAWQWRQQ